MYSKEKMLEMLTNDKSSVRYDACEWLRISQESSPEVIYALEKATHDTDPEVTIRAYRALQADVHHQMQIKLGMVEPDPIETERSTEAISTNNTSIEYTAMCKEIRSTGFWFLGLGVVQIILTGFLSAPWGVLLIVVGLISFYFRTASIFIIYGVTMVWAAVSNLIGFNIGWVIFAALQIYWTIRIFMKYRRYREVEKAYIETTSDKTIASQSMNRAIRFFPWMSPLFGCSAMMGLVLFLLIVFVVAFANKITNLPEYLGIIEGLLVNLGLLGFAIGLASLISKHRPKALGGIGMVAGIITVVGDLALALF